MQLISQRRLLLDGQTYSWPAHANIIGFFSLSIICIGDLEPKIDLRYCQLKKNDGVNLMTEDGDLEFLFSVNNYVT